MAVNGVEQTDHNAASAATRLTDWLSALNGGFSIYALLGCSLVLLLGSNMHWQSHSHADDARWPEPLMNESCMHLEMVRRRFKLLWNIFSLPKCRDDCCGISQHRARPGQRQYPWYNGGNTDPSGTPG